MKKTLPALLLTGIIAASCCGCGSGTSMEKLGSDNQIVEYQNIEMQGRNCTIGARPTYSGEFKSLPVFKINSTDKSSEKLKTLSASFGVSESDYENLTDLTEKILTLDKLSNETEKTEEINKQIAELYEQINETEKYYVLRNDYPAIENSWSRSNKSLIEKFSEINWLSSRLYMRNAENHSFEFSADNENNSSIYINDSDAEIFKNELKNYYTFGSEEQKIAFKALLEKHSDVFMNTYKDIEVKDKNSDEQDSETISAYAKKPQTDLEILLDYNKICDRVDWVDRGENQLNINVYSDDCYESVGEYSIITADEALQRLKNNEYCGTDVSPKITDDSARQKYSDGDKEVFSLNLVYGRDMNNKLRPIYVGTFKHTTDDNTSVEYNAWVDAIKY